MISFTFPRHSTTDCGRTWRHGLPTVTKSVYPSPSSTHCRHSVSRKVIHLLRKTTLHYLLTPCRRVLLEKLTGLQLVKKFPAFHGTRRFITALTSIRHLSLTWASPIQSIYPHAYLLEIHPNITHPSMPRSPQWCLSLRFSHQDPIRLPLLTHMRHMPSPSHPPIYA